MIPLLVFLLSFSSAVFAFPLFQRLPLPINATGPEAFAFDTAGRGPYTGVSNGGILRYEGPFRGFREFATTTQPANKPRCGGVNSGARSPDCGRPIGIGFNNRSELYIADANLGLCKVPVEGGQANCFLKSAEGVPFKFLDALDVDGTTGVVYFTDYSLKFNYSQILSTLITNDATGRLLSYDPSTRQVSVLLRGLAGPGGVAVSQDGSFLLVSEYNANRIRRHWIKGPRRNVTEIFVPFIARPDNIKRTANGDFWVASNRLLPVPSATAVRINAIGLVVQRISLAARFGIAIFSEVNEFGRTLYLGSLFNNFVGRYNL